MKSSYIFTKEATSIKCRNMQRLNHSIFTESCVQYNFSFVVSTFIRHFNSKQQLYSIQFHSVYVYRIEYRYTVSMCIYIVSLVQFRACNVQYALTLLLVQSTAQHYTIPTMRFVSNVKLDINFVTQKVTSRFHVNTAYCIILAQKTATAR